MDITTDRTDLFPELEPYERGTLDLDGRHQMYWEQSGNPDGAPVLFLHGGPGAGAAPIHRRFFDPRFYRVVIFDQRGAGRSKPFADIRDNTTPHLVADIERLRRRLGIERWLVFGGSWGAALALAYGIAHPDRCTGFVLRGVFLGRAKEVDWFLNGMGTIFPEARRAFVEFLPAAERDDPLGAYYRRLSDPDPKVHLPAAGAWCRYESACSNLRPKPESPDTSESNRAALALARIEAHYFVNGMYLDDDAILGCIERLHGLPAIIVQGRYDMVCPIVSADELARAWPDADITIVPDAGHSALEPGIRAALVAAAETMKRRA